MTPAVCRDCARLRREIAANCFAVLGGSAAASVALAHGLTWAAAAILAVDLLLVAASLHQRARILSCRSIGACR